MESPGPPDCTRNPKTGYFCDKTKIGKENLRVNLAAKYIMAEGNTLLSFIWTESITKFIQKMPGFFREL